MDELTPITRIESYLDAIVDGGTPPLEDITRIETFLEAIYNNTVCELTPITRIEIFLGKISGQDIELPVPVTRIELYLAAIAGEDVELPEQPITRVEYWLDEWANGALPDWETFTGAIVSFIAQRSAPMKELSVTLEPQQDLSHGDPSPTNICPISGWTGAEAYIYGENLIEVSADTNTWKGNGSYFTLTYGENSVTFTPTIAGSLSAVWKSFVVTQDMVGQKITFSRTITGGACTLVMSDTKDGEFNNSGSIIVNGEGTYTIVQNTVGRAIGIRWVNSTGQEQALSNVMLNFGDTAQPYTPYQGETVSVTFDQTVYGGSYDFVSGELIVEWISRQGSNFDWTYDGVRWQVGVSDLFNFPTRSANILFERYATSVSASAATENTGFTVGKAIYIYSSDSVNSPTGQIVYPLAEPQTIQLTGEQVNALKGTNNVWSNAGDVTVTAHGTPIVEPDAEPLQALNLLLGGAYHNNQTPEDVSDEEALDILLGGADR